ncbi:Basic blue protein [Apostasia shenzhenica]|uniref:Plantacyanin n=1 Tax=Apostasia shenzhenica TaxID=1088818 RepID=A0A2I0BAQ2_9ASPA|nr:Basic blue protein [Apostasia shenzhenica]
MDTGRGSAAQPMVLSLSFLLLLLLLSKFAGESATFTVGEGAGWTFDAVSWPNGKHFNAGDVLEFKYSPAAHNVVEVNAGGYRDCSTPARAKVFESGNDRITLRRGANYFICSFSGHCEAGMKVAVIAA